MYTMDHTFNYRSKKLIHACTKSSAHVHGTKIRVRNLKILEELLDAQGNGWFATDSQSRIQMSDGDPRTGTFQQTPVTAVILSVM